MQDWQIGMTWLSGKLAGIPELTALIGSGNDARAFIAGRVPGDAVAPYLTVARVSTIQAQPIGQPPVATTMLIDVALWDLGNDDSTITPVYDAIASALDECDPELSHGKNISCAVAGDMPPEPPPQTPGDPEYVRIGKTYEVFIGAT